MPITPTDVLSRVSREQTPASGGAWRLLLFMLFVLAVFLFSYLGLEFGYRRFLATQIERRETELTELAERVPREQQDEFLKFEFQLINLQKLLTRHVAASKALALLEANTHQRVSLRNLDLSVAERRINLQAVAESYGALTQQLAAYQRAVPSIARYQVSNVKASEGGRVVFDATLFLDPKVFSAN